MLFPPVQKFPEPLHDGNRTVLQALQLFRLPPPRFSSLGIRLRYRAGMGSLADVVSLENCKKTTPAIAQLRRRVAKILLRFAGGEKSLAETVAALNQVELLVLPKRLLSKRVTSRRTRDWLKPEKWLCRQKVPRVSFSYSERQDVHLTALRLVVLAGLLTNYPIERLASFYHLAVMAKFPAAAGQRNYLRRLTRIALIHLKERYCSERSAVTRKKRPAEFFEVLEQLHTRPWNR